MVTTRRILQGIAWGCVLFVGYIVFAFVVQQGFDIIVNQVFAQTQLIPSTFADQINQYAGSLENRQQFVQILEYILHILYLILRPLLAIAGASMDNSFVYGSMFYLDTMLRKFWQIMRTFANFAIAFVFLLSVLMSLVGKQFWGKDLKDIVKSTFVAGILVQMSRWILAVLIDLSTIGVASLGALPLNILNEQGDPLSEMRVLKMYSVKNFDIERIDDVTKVDSSTVYTCEGGTKTSPNGKIVSVPTPEKKRYFLPCWINNGVLIDKGTQPGEPLTREAYKQQFVESWKSQGIDISESDVSDDYCVYKYQLIKNEPRELTCSSLEDLQEAGIEMMETQGCSRLSDLIRNASGLSGPFFSLFASLMRMGDLTMNTNTVGLVETSFVFLLKAIVGIALVVPLFVLALVMVMRAVILWLVIAFSPILTLLYAYQKNIDALSIGGGNFSKLSHVLGLIFMPVFVVFAVSLTLIFLHLIARPDLLSEEENACQRNPVTVLGCIEPIYETSGNQKVNKGCYDVCGIVDICFTDTESTIGTNIVNFFAWSIVSFLGVAMMRIIVFTALKSSAFTEKIVGSIEKFSKSLIKTIPVVPIPGLGMQSIGTLDRAMSRAKVLPDQIAMKQRDSSGLRERLGRIQSLVSGGNDETKESLQNIVRSYESGDAGQMAQARSQAQSLIQDFSLAPGTSYRDLGENHVAKTYAVASGVNASDLNSIETLSDAFSHPDVINHLIEGGRYANLFDTLANGTTDTDVRESLIQQVRAGLERDVGAHRVGSRVQTPGGYIQLYAFDNGFVQDVSDDVDGRVRREWRSYPLSVVDRNSSDLNTIETMRSLIDTYGSLDALPDHDIYRQFVEDLRNAFSGLPAGTNEATIGNYRVRVTRDSATGNIVSIDRVERSSS